MESYHELVAIAQDFFFVFNKGNNILSNISHTRQSIYSSVYYYLMEGLLKLTSLFFSSEKMRKHIWKSLPPGSASGLPYLHP